MTCPYRKNLPPRPVRIEKLPLDERGYPIPKFVERIDGVPDFRVMSREHYKACVERKVCWLCGEPLGSNLVFVVGPMCVVNRTSGEPPCHYDCAVYAALSCPFLTLPAAKRNESGLDELGTIKTEGYLGRNPGVAALYVTRSYRLFRVSNGVLVRMGEAERVEWFHRGRPATREEVLTAFESGLPALQEVAKSESPKAVLELNQYVDRAMALVPA
jgi:hypothetical protein